MDNFKSLLFLSAAALSFACTGGNAAEQFNPGFYSPTGSTTSRVHDGWLENGCGPVEPYVSGFYHTGADFPRSFDSPVYAIWDGVVTAISINGWGDGNVAVVVKSKLQNGQEFLWLVGHVQAATSPNRNTAVVRGSSITNVGHYPLGDHVHLGIFPGTTLPSTDETHHIGLGRMGCGNWIDAQKFLNSFNTDLNSDASWELRSASLSYTNNRNVSIFHATDKKDSSVRMVTAWDPDRSAWDNWSAVPGPLDASSHNDQAKQDVLNRSLADPRFIGRPNTNGFVNPLEWIADQIPIDPASAQAENDCTRRALTDSRFNQSRGNLDVNVNWDPAWELRSLDFGFTGSRIVTIYDISYKTDRSVRYTNFYDPSQNAWIGWVRA